MEDDTEKAVAPAPEAPAPAQPETAVAPEPETRTVRMKVRISGTRDGADWPAIGEPLSVPAPEAEELIASGFAEAHTEADQLAAEEPGEGVQLGAGDPPAEPIETPKGRRPLKRETPAEAE